MTTSDFISVGSVIAALVGAYFAYLAYKESREIAFPRKKPHLLTQQIRPFSKELDSLNKFLAENIDRKVYLNFSVEPDEARLNEYTNPERGEKVTTLSVWIENYEPLGKGEEPSNVNSAALSLTFDGDVDRHIYWDNGCHLIKGYFTILGHGSKQGHYGARLIPNKIE